MNLVSQVSLACYRRPKNGFVNADFSSEAAEFNVAMSTLLRGRYKNSPPSVVSNPQSSRNSIPPIKLPTLSCSINFNKHEFRQYITVVNCVYSKPFFSNRPQQKEHKHACTHTKSENRSDKSKHILPRITDYWVWSSWIFLH